MWHLLCGWWINSYYVSLQTLENGVLFLFFRAIGARMNLVRFHSENEIYNLSADSRIAYICYESLSIFVVQYIMERRVFFSYFSRRIEFRLKQYTGWSSYTRKLQQHFAFAVGRQSSKFRFHVFQYIQNILIYFAWRNYKEK